jgi:hypothetical protein
MEEPSGLFSMDVHKLFRSFIPGLITITTFLFFCFAVEGANFFRTFFDFLEEYIFIILIFAYVLGIVIEWVAGTLLHRFLPFFAYSTRRLMRYEILFKEINLLQRVLGITNLNTVIRRRNLATLYDYSLNGEENRVVRERMYFKYSRYHSVHASLVGIILSYSTGLWLWDIKKCFNSSTWWFWVASLITFLVLFCFYRITRDNLIAYEQVYITNNVGRLRTLWRFLNTWA